MAKGDYHVEQKGGAWVIECEGHSWRVKEPVERLATRDQAWRIAVFYAQAAGVDVFVNDGRDIVEEKRFREDPRKRRR